jgi:hypothetical protein
MIYERLPDEVKRGIVEILGGEGGGVTRPPPWVVAVNALLLNQLHGAPAFPHTIVYSQQEKRIRYELPLALVSHFHQVARALGGIQSPPTRINTPLPFHRRLQAPSPYVHVGRLPICLQSAVLPGE